MGETAIRLQSWHFRAVTSDRYFVLKIVLKPRRCQETYFFAGIFPVATDIVSKTMFLCEIINIMC